MQSQLGIPRRIQFPVTISVLVSATLLLATQTTNACPNCPQGLRSYAEHLASADAVVLIEWVSAVEDTDERTGSTTGRIRQVVKGTGKLVPGKNVKLDGYRAGKPGDLLLLFGTLEDAKSELVWNDVIAANAASLQYILKVPAMEVMASKRLSYFLKYLEFPDELVANDAFAEFANAEYKDIVALAPQFPREKLRKWISSAQTPPVRLGLYATMLGLCGNADDAKLLESRISKQDAVGEYRLGLEGMISGYLMIQGEQGLELIDSKLLQNKSATFSDTFAAAHGLRFMWTYSNRISHERLCRSMEGLLVRAEMADIVIADLARWKDWSVQDRLVKLYGQKDYDFVSVKRAIIRYLIACTTQPAGEGKQAAMVTKQIEQAHKHLAELRRIDPKTVADAERFFLVP